MQLVYVHVKIDGSLEGKKKQQQQHKCYILKWGKKMADKSVGGVNKSTLISAYLIGTNGYNAANIIK